MRPARVLVVDDSGLARKVLRDLIQEGGAFQVVGVARDGREALRQVEELAPDLVTLDLDMPVLDGLSVLPQLVQRHRQRVLVLSTHAVANSYAAFKSLALGAIDFVSKPGSDTHLRDLAGFGRELRARLAAVARVPREKLGRATLVPDRPALEGATVQAAGGAPELLVAVGGSTGGTTALEAFLRGLRASASAAVVVVQHLPPGYSRPFASYLSGACALRVKEAEEGERVVAGAVYLAAGGRHLRVQRVRGEYRLRTDAIGPALHGFRPAIDEMFYSVALAARRRAAGVLLSGMGGDGGHGLAAIRALGGHTLVQDFESCVVPEMPMRAVALGAVERRAPAQELAAALRAACAWRESA